MPFRAWVQSLPRKATAQQHAFADPEIVKKLHDKPLFLPSVENLPPVPDDCVRMALWLYAPNAIDKDGITKGLVSPESRQAMFQLQAKEANVFSRKILGYAFDVSTKPPSYVSFTTEMEPAHTAGLPDLENSPFEKSCAVLCYVDVPLKLPVLEETVATVPRRRRNQRRGPVLPLPPLAFAVYGVLRRPFEGDYYTATPDGIVSCNYSKPHMSMKKTYTRTHSRIGFQKVISTQIFLSTELTSTHVHPVCVYHYSRAELGPPPTTKKKP